MSARQLAMLVGTAAVWGSSFLFIKIADRDLDPILVVVLRSVFAVALLLPILVLRGDARTARSLAARNLVPLATVGLFGATIPFLLVTWAERWVDSGLTGILNAASPLFTALLALRAGRHERVTGWRLGGVLAGFAGVAVLVGANPSSGTMTIVGSLMILAGSLSFAAASLYGARRLAELPPLLTATAAILTSTVLMLPVGLARLPDHAPSWEALGSTVALGVGGSGIAYLLYYAVLAEVGASRTILVTYLVPPIALFYGTAFLDEPVTASALVGLALILAGVALGSGRRPGGRRASRRAARS